MSCLDSVFLDRCAEIASYLSVLHRANVIKAAVSGKVVTARTHVTSTAGGKSGKRGRRSANGWARDRWTPGRVDGRVDGVDGWLGGWVGG